MKTLRSSAVILALFLLQATNASAHSFASTDSVKVWGNCEMCKARIEKAAKQAGATSANWNIATHILTVSFDGQKANVQSVEQKVSEAGHDTERFTAPAEVYKTLPGCCQYERKQANPTSKAFN